MVCFCVIPLNWTLNETCVSLECSQPLGKSGEIYPAKADTGVRPTVGVACLSYQGETRSTCSVGLIEPLNRTRFPVLPWTLEIDGQNWKVTPNP